MKVIDVLSQSNTPIDVASLVNKIKVNKTTVYRQIDKLIKDGKIVEVEFGDGKKRYELKSLGHHHHLVCKNCGILEDISFNEETILKEVSKKTDFLIESHSLEFFGLCNNCK